MMTYCFEAAFDATMQIEGWTKRTNRKCDPGGDTYSGISRVYWPEWRECKYFDHGDYKKADGLVKYFYRVNFWNRIQGDTLAELSPTIAYEVFDTAVHCGVHKTVKILQTAYNVANSDRHPLVEDGLLGPKDPAGG